MNELKNEKNHEIGVGEICILGPDSEFVAFEVENRLVAILYDHQKIDGTLTVIYLDKLTQLATDRDFIITKKESHSEFDFALWPDFSIRVKKDQLTRFPKLGSIDISMLRQVENLASLMQDQSFYNMKEKFQWKIGKYIPFYGDKVWLRRSQIMDSLNALAADIEVEATMSRFFELYSDKGSDGLVAYLEINSIADAKIVCEFANEYVRAALV